jgi:hypothetical protein
LQRCAQRGYFLLELLDPAQLRELARRGLLLLELCLLLA